MPVAIVTHYLGPTNYRGARIVAAVPSRIADNHRRAWSDYPHNPSPMDRDGYWRLTISYPYELSGEAAHRVAAEALAARLGWTGHLVSGGLDDGYAYCFTDHLEPTEADPVAVLADIYTGPTSGTNAQRLAPSAARNLADAGYRIVADR